MASVIGARVAALAAALAAATGRTVSRELQDFAARSRTDLVDGLYTLLVSGEQGFATYRGREAQLGTLRVILVGQLEVEPDAPQSDMDEAEWAMAEEIKAFCAALPDELGGLYVSGWRSSAQADFPYGGVAFEMEWQP